MTESLADIEALSLRCRSEQSRGYISESLLCYKSGAYRATIVTAWIALVFDLIDKIRELSIAGDAEAKALEAKIDSYIAQIEQGNGQGIKASLEFERTILEICRDKLDFFDAQQFTDLERLREDRHRCAHPSFHQIGIPYNPSAEHARLHLRNAIVYVLSQPPVQGKAALAALKTLVASSYFPKDNDGALVQLRASALATANAPLVRSFVDALVFSYFTVADPLYYKEQVFFALNAASVMHAAIVEDRLRKQINKAVRDFPDATFSGAACLVSRLNNAWALLDQASKDKIKAFVESGPNHDVLSGLGTMSKIMELQPSIRTRIGGLELAELANVINPNGVGALAKDRALALLQEAESWGQANSIFSDAVLPLFEYLEAADVERIIRMPTEHGSDLVGAHGYRLFIEEVRERQVIGHTELDQLLRTNGATYLLPQTGNA